MTVSLLVRVQPWKMLGTTSVRYQSTVAQTIRYCFKPSHKIFSLRRCRFLFNLTKIVQTFWPLNLGEKTQHQGTKLDFDWFVFAIQYTTVKLIRIQRSTVQSIRVRITVMRSLTHLLIRSEYLCSAQICPGKESNTLQYNSFDSSIMSDMK